MGEILVIHDWMARRLHLKGSELVVYALICSECRANHGDYVRMSTKWLQWWTGLHETSVSLLMKRMVERGVIERKNVGPGPSQVRWAYRPTPEKLRAAMKG